MQSSFAFEKIRFQVTDPSVVLDVDLSGDGKLAVTAEVRPNRVTVWDVLTGERVSIIEGHQDSVTCVALSAAGDSLASGSDDCTVRFYASIQEPSKMSVFDHDDHIHAVSFSPDGHALASASGDGTIHFWNISTGASLLRIAGHSGAVKAMAYSPGGTQLASGGEDKIVRIWDAQNGTLLKTFRQHSETVTSVAYSPDGRFVASRGSDEMIYVFDLKHDNVLPIPMQEGCCVFIRPTLLLVGYYREDFLMKVWNAENGREIQTVKGESDEIWSIAFSRHSNIVICGGGGRYGGTIEMWKINFTGQSAEG